MLFDTYFKNVHHKLAIYLAKKKNYLLFTTNIFKQ